MKRTTPHNPIEPVLDRALCQLRAWNRASFGRAVSVRASGQVALFEYRSGVRVVSEHPTVELALIAISKGKLKWRDATPVDATPVDRSPSAKRATY